MSVSTAIRDKRSTSTAVHFFKNCADTRDEGREFFMFSLSVLVLGCLNQFPKVGDVSAFSWVVDNHYQALPGQILSALTG